jgi:hypothetical protein
LGVSPSPPPSLIPPASLPQTNALVRVATGRRFAVANVRVSAALGDPGGSLAADPGRRVHARRSPSRYLDSQDAAAGQERRSVPAPAPEARDANAPRRRCAGSGRQADVPPRGYRSHLIQHSRARAGRSPIRLQREPSTRLR